MLIPPTMRGLKCPAGPEMSIIKAMAKATSATGSTHAPAPMT